MSADDGSLLLQEIELDDYQVSYPNDPVYDDLQTSSNAVSVNDESENSLICSQDQHQAKCKQCQMLQEENLILLRRIDLSSINEKSFVNNDEKGCVLHWLVKFCYIEACDSVCHFRGS